MKNIRRKGGNEGEQGRGNDAMRRSEGCNEEKKEAMRREESWKAMKVRRGKELRRQ